MVFKLGGRGVGVGGVGLVWRQWGADGRGAVGMGEARRASCSQVESRVEGLGGAPAQVLGQEKDPGGNLPKSVVGLIKEMNTKISCRHVSSCSGTARRPSTKWSSGCPTARPGGGAPASAGMTPLAGKRQGSHGLSQEPALVTGSLLLLVVLWWGSWVWGGAGR